MENKKMLAFEYVIILKQGYRPVMQTHEEDEVRIVVKAPNRATADRMVKAITTPGNVAGYDGICIE